MALTSFAPRTASFGSGAVTPLTLCEQQLACIAAREPEVKAFAHLDTESARAAAQQAGQRWANGVPRSRIDGMLIGIKDVIETIDMPTGQGSPLFEGVRTNRDGAAAQAVREAGAIIIGKTTTAEMATTEPGPTRNPHDLARTPGGSSSGSAAAVGAGMLSAAIGTQVVGSILRPASYCGTFGFKPTFGGLNRGGAYDQFSQSCIGVLSASLDDGWAVAQAIVQRVGGDPGHDGLEAHDALPDARQPARLMMLQTEGWAHASAGARSAFEGVRSRLAAAGVVVAGRSEQAAIEALEQALADAFALTRTILAWEWRWPLLTYAARDARKLSASLRARLAMGQAMTLSDYKAALARRADIRKRFDATMDGYDGVIALSATGAAPLGMPTGDASMNVAASLLGAPAVSLPLLSDENLPLGLQLIGRSERDADLFSVAGGILDIWQG